MGGFNFGGMTPKASGGPAAGGMAECRMAEQELEHFPISVFVGQGDDGFPMVYRQKGSKVNSGFYVQKTDQFNLMSEVINYENKEQEVYVSLEYEYLPNYPTEPKDLHDVGMGAINVSPCGLQALHPPANKPIKYESPPRSVTGDGYLLNITPHLHDGGINMTFSINGKAACTSTAVYGTSGSATINGEKWETIGAYTPCDGVQIKNGDKLTMEAWYDLTKHRMRPQANNHNEEAEGMALGTFIYAKP